MTHSRYASSPRTSRPPGHDTVRGGLRFLVELIAWVATPWALWQHSIPLAIGSVVLLIGLPATFGTPGDRPGGDSPVPVPGIVTVLLVLMELIAAAAASWALFPWWPAAGVTALCVVVVATEQPRWRALVGYNSR